MSSPAKKPEWLDLQNRAGEPRGLSALSMPEGAGIAIDFSRQHIDAAVLAGLAKLAVAMDVESKRDALLSGNFYNATENRLVLHTTLRANADSISVPVADQLDRMRVYSDQLRDGIITGASGKPFTDVVNIGIGGSSLGPEMVYAALQRFANGPRIHFVSNIDGAHLADTLAGLDPQTTLFIVASKTFTTDETLTNASSAGKWLESRASIGSSANRHFLAVTANKAEAMRQGYAEGQIFEFWDWVGGRYSIWSAIGLPLAIGLGFKNFQQLLAGASAMDEHFQHAPLIQNLPVLLALAGIWNRNFLGMNSLAILPYSQRLAMLPRYLQQLEMESNGKRVDLDGKLLDYATCPVVFGDAGTNSQHSFHQLLHQGTDVLAADIIVVAEAESDLPGHHQKLLANALAQADALWRGKTFEAACAELAGQALSDGQRASLAMQKTYPGGRPSSILVMPRLDAYSLGALLAMYEHKVFVQGVIWNINSFDQWGVELGKAIAKQVLPVMRGEQTQVPAHLSELVSRLRRP